MSNNNSEIPTLSLLLCIRAMSHGDIHIQWAQFYRRKKKIRVSARLLHSVEETRARNTLIACSVQNRIYADTLSQKLVIISLRFTEYEARRIRTEIILGVLSGIMLFTVIIHMRTLTRTDGAKFRLAPHEDFIIFVP